MAGSSFSGRGRGSGGTYVTWQNARLVSDILNEIEDGLKSRTNKELRQAAKEIAKDVLIPQLKRAARSSPVPQARAFAETARPKADRVVMVQIGGVNPPLSGFKRGVGKKATGTTRSGRAGTSRNYRTSMAWGSTTGPFPGADVNNYRVPRRDPAGSYWVIPGTTNALPESVKRYETYLEQLIRTRSKYR